MNRERTEQKARRENGAHPPARREKGAHQKRRTEWRSAEWPATEGSDSLLGPPRAAVKRMR
jgi:hypothetical protein